MAIVVRANMAQEVFNYFKHLDLNKLCDALLEKYDFMNLPLYSGTRDIVKNITITNETFIVMYNALGPRSNKLSISRLLEYAYLQEVLDDYEWVIQIPVTDGKSNRQQAGARVSTAYNILLDACKLVPEDEILKEATQFIGSLGRGLKGE